MHYHCEIVMPPTEDIDGAVAKVMERFDENCYDDEHHAPKFWDWYVCGGRWGGEKMKVALGSERLEAFYAALTEHKVTVSGFKAGKDQLEPESQIPMVDALWHEHFPETTGPCPLFKHSERQYGSDTLPGDVCKFSEVPEGLKCSRIIFAGPSVSDELLEPTFMLSEDSWNGVNHQKSDWDCTFAQAVVKFTEKLENYRETYAATIRPQDDWLVVTIDYHS